MLPGKRRGLKGTAHLRKRTDFADASFDSVSQTVSMIPAGSFHYILKCLFLVSLQPNLFCPLVQALSTCMGVILFKNAQFGRKQIFRSLQAELLEKIQSEDIQKISLFAQLYLRSNGKLMGHVTKTVLV